MVLNADIKKAAEVIEGGGLVVFPSDTVYILAVDPTNKLAVEKLLGFKERWTGKAISIAVLNKKMALDYVKLSENAQNIYTNLLKNNGFYSLTKEEQLSEIVRLYKVVEMYSDKITDLENDIVLLEQDAAGSSL